MTLLCATDLDIVQIAQNQFVLVDTGHHLQDIDVMLGNQCRPVFLFSNS